MRIYRIAIDESVKQELKEANQELQSIVKMFEKKYEGLNLWVYENEASIRLDILTVPEDMRRQGIGSEIIRTIQDFAQKQGKPVVVAPEAARGYKKKLDDYYKGHGFVTNKGRNTDYRISDPFARTMYWQPK